jgi:hypothetical protein
MGSFKLPLDEYDRKARLFPMFLVLSPLGVSVFLWYPVDLNWLGTIAGLAVALGGATFLSQIARDKGKYKETFLYKKWGGKPSTKLLSYKYSTLSPKTVSRYHKKLKELDPSLWFPASLEEEDANTENAFSSYESCGDLLRVKTRDSNIHSLLFNENISYGYRRNTWGMKPLGIANCIIGTVVAGSALWVEWSNNHAVDFPALLSISYSVILLFLWISYFNTDWVKIAADAYAERLVTSCETL